MHIIQLILYTFLLRFRSGISSRGGKFTDFLQLHVELVADTNGEDSTLDSF